MSDYSWDNVSRGFNNLVKEMGDEVTHLQNEWHDYWHPNAKSDAQADKHPAAKDAPKAAAKDAPQAAPAAVAKDAIPAPDKDGVLTISADSPNFQKAIEQPNIHKLVINQRGDVNFQVGLTTDEQHKPIFVGQIYEKTGGKVDKTFALPGNVDYVTINQINKSADGKTDVVTPFTQVAGQGRLAAYKQAFNSDQFFPGSFELKPVAGVQHEYPIPPTAGTNDVFRLVKTADRMNDDLLELGQKQFRHDATVPENNKDPWFGVMLAKLDTLEAGKNLADCGRLPATERDNIANNAYNFLNRADSEYQTAEKIALSHLADRDRPVHNPIYGRDPRNWHEMPRTQTGALDWKNPQADITYYGSALDLSAYEQQQAKIAKDRVKTASEFVCTESLDQLLP